MEIRRWLCYILLTNWALISYSVAKPFSLNEALAAESQQNQQLETTTSPANRRPLLETTNQPKVSETTAERFSLNRALNHAPLKLRKSKGKGSIIPRSKKISPLSYRKTYQIRSPLKPKKLKYQQKLRNKRKNQSYKREVNDNEKFNKKYIPLLRNLGMLFDNLLTTDASGSKEIKTIKYKRNRHNSKDRNEVVCSCTRKSDSDVAESKPYKKAVTTTTARAEVTTDAYTTTIETTTAPTDNSTTGDVSSLGPYTDLSVLLTRNTAGAWGDDNGFSERSSPTLHRSAKGNITGVNRNGEHNTGSRQNISDSTDDEKDPCSPSRDDASSDEYTGRERGRISRNRNDTPSPVYRGATDETNKPSKGENINEHIGGDINEFERENKLETTGDETNSTEFVPKLVRRFRGFVPEDKIGNNTESLQSKEDHEESFVDIASDKRVPNRNGPFATEDQKTSPANEVITIKDLSSPILVVQNSPRNKAPSVTIFDGYSVARDINGQNKLTEKSIHVHS